MNEFVVEVTHPYPSFQWYHRVSGDTVWNEAQTVLDCSGAKTNRLLINSIDQALAGHVKCIISNPAGDAVETREAVLAVGGITVTITPDLLTLQAS